MNGIVPGMERWSDAHDSAFKPSKTDTVLFLPLTRKRPIAPPRVVLRGVPIAYAPSLTMLGTESDEKLTFGPHIARTASRATAALCGVGLLARQRAGLAPRWETALAAHLTEIAALPSGSLLVYSDGSLLDDCAGAGVAPRVVLDGGEAGAEDLWLEGLRLALATLATSPPPTEPTTVLVAIDTQAVLLQPTSPAPTSGQQHRLTVRALLLKLKRTHLMLELRLRWVPGHRDITGNERADVEAKRGAEGGGRGERGGGHVSAPPPARAAAPGGNATVGRSEQLEQLVQRDESEWEGCGRGDTSAEVAARVPSKSPPRLEQRSVLTADGLVEGGEELPKAISALWQQHKVEERAAWELEWAAAKVGRGLHRLAPSPSTAHRYHAGLSRRQATLLTRLRLDCASLTATSRGPANAATRCASAARRRPASTTSSTARSTPAPARAYSHGYRTAPSRRSLRGVGGQTD
ncbi:hypothetical protein JCM10449v2_003629 [Rhodotorula kratochvilovae]